MFILYVEVNFCVMRIKQKGKGKNLLLIIYVVIVSVFA